MKSKIGKCEQVAEWKIYRFFIETTFDNQNSFQSFRTKRLQILI